MFQQKHIDNEIPIQHETKCPKDCTCAAQHVDCGTDSGQGELTGLFILLYYEFTTLMGLLIEKFAQKILEKSLSLSK